MAHTAQERYYHTPQGDVEFGLRPAKGLKPAKVEAPILNNHAPQGDVGQDLTIISAQYGFEVSHPARGRRTRRLTSKQTSKSQNHTP